MPFPAGIITRQITVGPILGPLGGPTTGNVIITASTTLIQQSTSITVLSAPITVPLAAGLATVELPVSRQPDLVDGDVNVIQQFTYYLEYQIAAPNPPKPKRFELVIDVSPLNVLPNVPIPDAITTIGIVDWEGIVAAARGYNDRAEELYGLTLNAQEDVNATHASALALWNLILNYQGNTGGGGGTGGGVSIDEDGVPYLDTGGLSFFALDEDGVPYYIFVTP